MAGIALFCLCFAALGLLLGLVNLNNLSKQKNPSKVAVASMPAGGSIRNEFQHWVAWPQTSQLNTGPPRQTAHG